MSQPIGRPSSSLDKFDLAILDIIQKDNLTPLRVIGKAVNLSAPAVQRRIKRLTRQGIIKANVAMVDQIKLSRPITVIVEVEMENEQIEILDETKAVFMNRAEVQQCYYVTGDVDFILVITVVNMVEYERLTRELFFSNSNIKRFRTLVTMDQVKTGLFVPVSGE